jgi:DNA-directed RNA polymerase
VANCGAFKVEVGDANGKKVKVGIDKVPFEERIKWVDDNLTWITAAVLNPLKDPEFIGPTRGEFWMQADAPFLFLAACRELVSALTHGPEYVSRLPVSWDGACNGLQHLAAMTRAPEGLLVNLTNDPEPHDVYQVVAASRRS